MAGLCELGNILHDTNNFAHNGKQVEERKETLQAQSESITMVPDTEDYRQIQLTETGLRSGGNESFVFERDEITAHHFNKNYLSAWEASQRYF